jgi:RNA polymerase sigma-70 factor, ECF subfamily
MSPDTRPSLLLRICNAADQLAWEEFLATYEPILRRVLRSKGVQPADADELIQEVLLAVMRSIPTFQSNQRVGAFRRWIATILQSKLLDLQRRQKTQNERHAKMIQRSQPEDFWHLESMSIDDLDKGLDQQLEHQVFYQATQAVRKVVHESTWLAFWRTEIEQKDAMTVATELNLSVGQVYVSRSRVLAKLRKYVADCRANNEEVF